MFGDSKNKGEPRMHLVMNGFAVIGAVVVAYGGVRVVATGVDIFQRWRRSRAGDVNAWKA